jgi:HPt (histidine-containing phosphotransfer) domain-containing protein
MSDFAGIDPEALTRLNAIGGTDFVRQMIDLFLEEAPGRLSAARAGEKSGDLEAVALAAHSLKSSAHNFGANRLARLAEEIESRARANHRERLSDLLGDLERAYVSVKVFLENQRNAFKK